MSEEKKPWLSAISYELKEARKKKGLSQRALAKKMNVHQNTICRVEGGKNMRIGTIYDYCKALDVIFFKLPAIL